MIARLRAAAMKSGCSASAFSKFSRALLRLRMARYTVPRRFCTNAEFGCFLSNASASLSALSYSRRCMCALKSAMSACDADESLDASDSRSLNARVESPAASRTCASRTSLPALFLSTALACSYDALGQRCVTQCQIRFAGDAQQDRIVWEALQRRRQRVDRLLRPARCAGRAAPASAAGWGWRELSR